MQELAESQALYNLIRILFRLKIKKDYVDDNTHTRYILRIRDKAIPSHGEEL